MSISLITLVTPLLALWLGAQVAHEQLSPQLLAGTGFVLAAMVVYHSSSLLKPLLTFLPTKYAVEPPEKPATTSSTQEA